MDEVEILFIGISSVPQSMVAFLIVVALR